MGKELKIFFIGLANSFRPDGYNNIVEQPKRLGDMSRKINTSLNKKYKTVLRESNEQLTRISTY